MAFSLALESGFVGRGLPADRLVGDLLHKFRDALFVQREAI